MKVCYLKESELTSVEPGTILIPNVGLREIEREWQTGNREQTFEGYIMWMFLGCCVDSKKFLCIQILSDKCHPDDKINFPHGVVVIGDIPYHGVVVELVESH